MCSDSTGGKLLFDFKLAGRVKFSCIGSIAYSITSGNRMYRGFANIESNHSLGIKEASTQQQQIRSTHHWVQWQQIMGSK